MDTSSEFESSEIEEDKTFDTLTPSPENPHPLSTDHSKYLPPLEKLPLPKGLKIKLKSIFSNDSIPKIHSLLFWQVFYKKLKPETTEVLQDQTSKKLAKNYVKLLLSLMNQPAGKAIDLLPVLFGHSIHHEYFELFSQSRHHFDQRFILDCYKIIYLELSGLTVTDSFIETSAKKVLGNYYLEYLKTQKKKPQNNSGLASKKLEKQMNGVEGGIEFAKELALRLRPLITRKPERKQAEEEEVKLEISDTIIADRVHRHLSEKVLKKSFITDSSKIFNCNKLSPLLSRQINSSTKEIPYKHRYVTPHKIEKPFEQPSFLRVLKKHCDEKSAVILSRKRILEKDLKSSKSNANQKTIEISPLGPQHSPCLSEVFKLRAKLNEFNYYQVLLGNKKKTIL